MHEMSIAQGMLQVALDYAAEHHAQRITRFNIEISALADESEDSLRFYFETLTPGTIAERARVEIVRAPSPVKCLQCRHEFTVGDLAGLACPKCSSQQLQLLPQDEFRLASIDVE